MTVKELRARLEKLDAESPVVLVHQPGNGEGGYLDIQWINVVYLAPRTSPASFYPQFRNLPERNTVKAVVLEY
jgi:hypothetical protein